jgi:hypothetical protein
LPSYPALVTNALGALTTNTNTNNVGGGVEELLGEADELLVAHLLGQVVDSHGVDELAVTNGGAIGHVDSLVLCVDLGYLAVLSEALLLLGKSVGDSDPNTTSTVTGGEAESSIRAPVTSNLVQDDVFGDCLDIGSSDTLTKPCALHLSGRISHVSTH